MKKLFGILLMTAMASGTAVANDDEVQARIAPVGSTCMQGDKCAAAPAPAAAAALLRKPPTQADCSPFEVRISPTGWPKRPQGPRPQAGHCWWLCPWESGGGQTSDNVGSWTVGAAGPVSVAQKALLGRSSQETGAGTGPVAMLAPWHFISYA